MHGLGTYSYCTACFSVDQTKNRCLWHFCSLFWRGIQQLVLCIQPVMINYAIKQVPCFKMDSSLEYALLCDDGGFYRPFSGTHDAYKSSGFFFYLSPLLGLSVHVLGQWKRMCSFKESCIFLWDPTSYKGFVYLAFQCLISSWCSLCWRLHWIAAQCSQMYVNIWDKFKGSRTCCEDWFFCCNDHAEDVCHLPKKMAPSSSCHGLCAASADAPSPCLHFQPHWSTPHHTLHCYT